jgi:Amt family ammonium transporter
MMTLPGLALFYGGLVRRKNVVSVLAQCFGITGMVTVVWWLCGYSLIFGANFTPDPTHPTTLGFFFGGTEFNLFKGVNSIPNTNYGNWVSQNVYACFQLMFAVITPALIIGSIAERMKYSALMLFMTAWMFVVYFPQAHMLWGITGFMNGCWNAVAPIKAIDFAGGTVVHMSSGWSALTLCIILGPRLGFGKVPMPPHSIVNVLIGTGLLWVGWYGFNSGSAVAGDVIAANAFTTTTLATATGAMTWALVEWVVKGKPTCLGYCSGAVAGLVVITPAAGYVNPTGSMWIGLASGTIPFFFVYKVKGWLGYDDALDTFGVHAIGGTTGAIMTGILADPNVNANLPTFLGTLISTHTLWIEQVKAVGVTICLACCGTAIIAFILKFTIGIRPTPEQEEQGLDLTDHSEEGYILD